MADPECADPNDPEYAKALLERLVRGTRLSNAMPADIQHDYAATFPGYQAAMAGMGARLTGMMQGFVDQQGSCSAAVPAGSMDDVSTRFDTVVELSDRLLDRVDADLDRHRGGAGVWPTAGGPALGASLQAPHRPQAGAALSAGSATRPQLRWREEVDMHEASHERPVARLPPWPDGRCRTLLFLSLCAQVDNSSRPFIPKLRSKPNAIVPLELRLEQPEAAHAELGTTASNTQPAAWYANPYAPEISAFTPSEVCGTLTRKPGGRLGSRHLPDFPLGAQAKRLPVPVQH